MLLSIEFCTMYEPGENAPPQLETEYTHSRSVESIPSYSDIITYNGYEYFTYDVKHHYESEQEKYSIRATRKVTRLPIDKRKKI